MPLPVTHTGSLPTQPNLAQTVGYDDYMQYINRNKLPPQPASGPYYSPAGVREAYEANNIPPILQQHNPFATAGYRTFVDPFGQMMVQPLVGFSSTYPHVLSGVPTNPFYGFDLAAQMGPLTWPIQYPSSAPFMQPQRQRGSGRSRGAGTSNTNRNTNTTTPPAGQPTPPEWDWYHNAGETTPLPLPPRVVSTQSGAGVPVVTANNASAPIYNSVPVPIDDGVNFDYSATLESNPIQNIYDLFGRVGDWFSRAGLPENATWDANLREIVASPATNAQPMVAQQPMTVPVMQQPVVIPTESQSIPPEMFLPQGSPEYQVAPIQVDNTTAFAVPEQLQVMPPVLVPSGLV